MPNAQAANYKRPLEELVGKYFCELHEVNSQELYEIEYINPENLICSERLDLMAKIMWLEAKETGKGMEYATSLYREQVVAITDRTGKEPGNANKNSIDEFVNTFEKLRSIKETGLNETISVVPVDKNNVIMDGAHRTAIAYYYNLQVPIVRIPLEYSRVDAKRLLANMMKQEYVEDLVRNYCKLKNKNIYVACIWPKATGELKRKKAEKIIKDNSKIIYKKEIPITFNGLRNLMIQIYREFDWLGDIKQNFPGASNKARYCWSENSSVIFYFIENPIFDEILDIKKKIRNIFNVENHSIHITDNNNETCQIANLILNVNSLDLLNRGQPDKYYKVNSLIEEFKKIVNKNGEDINNYIIDSSAVLALYGLREVGDLDYLGFPVLNLYNETCLEYHEEYLRYHEKCLDDLLYDPQYHLYYNSVKFISLEVLRGFKTKRNEKKDEVDVKLMDTLLFDRRGFKRTVYRIKLFFRYIKFYIRFNSDKLKMKIKNNKCLAPIYLCLRHMIKGR